MLVLAVFLLGAGVVSGAEYIHVWNRTALYIGASNHMAYGVATDSQDSIIVTGNINDFWTIKYDKNGNHLWNRTAGGPSTDYASGIATDSQDSIIVTGWTDSFGEFQDFLTVKYDENGNLLWSKALDKGGTEYARSVATDSQDNVIATGMKQYLYEYILTIKYDKNGNHIWNQTRGGTGDNKAYGIATDSQNNIIIAGKNSSNFLTIKYDENGNLIWSKTGTAGGSAYGVATDSQDNVIISGDSFQTIKYDKNGNLIWSKTGTAGNTAYGVATDSQDNVIVAGTNTNDFLTIVYDKNGNLLWSKTEGGSYNDYARSVATDSQDSIIVTGYDSLYHFFWTIKYRYNCTTCPNDISLTDSDIFFLEKQGNEVNISATVHNGNTYINQAEVEFIESSNGVLVKNKTITITDINPSSTKTASLAWNLASGNKVYVFVDPDDKIDESSEDNNYASKEYIGLPKFYVEADVGLTKVDEEIENFIESSLKFGFPVDNSEEADVLIAAARHNPLVMLSLDTLDRGWGFEGNGVKNQGRTESKPYGAVIGSLDKNGKHYIYVEGNDIDGFVAGAKELVKQEDRLIEGESSFLIDENNTDALAVYDYLHTPTNLPYYKKDNNAFAGIVGKALDDEMYESDIKIINTSKNVMLRLKHLDPEYTNIQNYKNEDGTIVVLSQGIHSSLSTWEDFGKEMASSEAKDTWLIEMVGGPYIDEGCGTACPNYTFYNLTNDYWPALIGAVQAYTGKTNLSYVGYSLGCSAALESLELYNTGGKANAGKLSNGTTFGMSSYPINTFVAVACPGNFTKLSTFMRAFNGSYPEIKDELDSHILMSDLKKKVITAGRLVFSDEATFLDVILSGMAYIYPVPGDRMSAKIYEEFYNWINNPNEPQIGKDVGINNFAVMEGKIKGGAMDLLLPERDDDTDLIVPADDLKEICKNVISNNKYYLSFRNRLHSGPPNIYEYENFEDIVKEFLDKKQIITQKYIGQFMISNQTNCE